MKDMPDSVNIFVKEHGLTRLAEAGVIPHSLDVIEAYLRAQKENDACVLYILECNVRVGILGILKMIGSVSPDGIESPPLNNIEAMSEFNMAVVRKYLNRAQDGQ